MTRALILQQILDLFRAPAYLEVGVAQGVTFHAVKASRKVAVDPRFLFKERPAPPPGASVEYHEVPSDTYFGTLSAKVDRFDVIFLDGLHTFEQTLRDLINALQYLSPTGVIVIDDVRPISYAAALPSLSDMRAVKSAMRDKDDSWMGDVYKLVLFVETFFQQFSFATIQENHGQLVMWREKRPTVPLRDIGFFDRLQFHHCFTERNAFRIQSFDAILPLIKASLDKAVDQAVSTD